MRFFNILLTVVMMIAYFGYDYKFLNYGTLLVILFLSELVDLMEKRNE